MADVAPDTATYQDKSDVGEKPADLVKLWLSAIALSGKGEEAWRKKGDETEALYHAEAERAKTSQKVSQFNILYTNTETLIPALYNSTPAPDCRRRFGDADPIGKVVAQITERCISVTVDQLDFDSLMLATVQDSEVPGRGVSRVRYAPTIGNDQKVADERVEIEHIEWKSIRIGPAKRWTLVPWVAFEHFLTREQLVELNPEIGGSIKLESAIDGADKHHKTDGEGTPAPEVFKRSHAWEIWDRESRKVLFICDSYKDAPLRVEDDPLQLRDFFPIPRPLYGFQKAGSLIPTCPYSLYESQANELEDITRRLKQLVKVLRWRGIAASEVMGAFESLKNLDDGELAPSSEAIHWSDKGLDKSIWMMPIDALIAVIKELYLAREQVKATIFEITGVADIMRGDTDPNETLGAQKIKAQWGSLRLNRRQQEVARYARDLFRLIAEIVAGKFNWQTISLMTGVNLPSQVEKQQAMQAAQANPQMAQQAPPEMVRHFMQPSREEVEAVLRRDLLREFRVDIESDSTIRADMERTQQNVANFVTGLGQFFSGIGPAVEGGYLPPDTAAALLTGFARNFKLGKQAEDALDELQERAKQAASQPKPDPEAQKVEAEARIKEQELALKKEEMGAKLGFEREKHAQTMEFEREKHGQDMQMRQQDMIQRQQEAAANYQLQERKLAGDHMLAERKQQDDAQIKREGIEAQSGTKLAIEGMRADHQTLNEGITGQTKQMVNEAVGALSEGIGQGLSVLAAALEKLASSQQQLAQVLTADTELVRDKTTGRAVGTRRIMPTIQ